MDLADYRDEEISQEFHRRVRSMAIKWAKEMKPEDFKKTLAEYSKMLDRADKL